MTYEYSNNVFINCPFDNEYRELFNAMTFSIFACEFIPRCAIERDDSDEIRIDKILHLIEISQYSIHDLSRIETTNDMPRFNMPLELGLFIGCKRYKHKDKKYLILDSEPFRFKQFISDLGGQDIKSHENSIEKIIGCVRDWLASKSRKKSIPHASNLFVKYQQFLIDLPQMCQNLDWTVNELTFLERSSLISSWLKK